MAKLTNRTKEDKNDISRIIVKVNKIASVKKDKPECLFHGVEIHIFPPQMTEQSLG